MICRVCHQEKPPEAFSNSRRHSSGKNTICKACAAARLRGYRRADPERWLAHSRRQYARHRERYLPSRRIRSAAYRQKNAQAFAAGERTLPATKRCSRCQQEKPAVAFARTSTTPDGLMSYCRACYRDYHQERKARKHSPDANKALVRQWIEQAWNQNFHGSAIPPVSTNPDAVPIMETIRFWSTVFQDIQISIEDQLAEGDKVVTRWTFRGIPRPAWAWMMPSDTPVVVTGIAICRIAGGKVVHAWLTYDALGLLQQLGLDPRRAGT